MSDRDDALALARACADRMYSNDRASKALGMRIEILAPGIAEARMRVRDDMVNGYDICHGGLIFALADSAFAFACNGFDNVTVAAGASIDFLAPAHTGDELLAHAELTHRGRRNGVYDVLVTNQHGRQVALFRGRSAALGRPILEPASE